MSSTRISFGRLLTLGTDAGWGGGANEEISFEVIFVAALCEGAVSGTIMVHTGSVGLDGSEDDDRGRSRTRVELSQS